MGGSRGTIQLAELAREKNKFIIPLNIDLGNDASKLIIERLNENPLKFYPNQIAGQLLSIINNFSIKSNENIEH